MADTEEESTSVLVNDPPRTRIAYWPLAVAYFFGLSTLFTHVSLTSLVTASWIDRSQADGTPASDKIPNGLATVPMACLILFSSLIIPPAGMVMQKHGYRRVFLIGTVLSVLSAVLCFVAVVMYERKTISPVASLMFLAASVSVQGLAYGIVHFYRHVAAVLGKVTAPAGMSVNQAASRAIAIVITSGALAGIAGPGVADIFNSVIREYPYSGTYLALGVVALIQMGCLKFVDIDGVFAHVQAGALLTPATPPPPQRPLKEIVLIPKFLGSMLTATCAHATMLCIMTIAPLLVRSSVSFALSSLIIQVHVCCMYVPSFGTSLLVTKFGSKKIACIGLVVAAAGATLLFVSESRKWGFYSAVLMSLALIGVGWNLTYVAATTAIATVYTAEERFKAQSFNDFVVFSIGSLVTLGSGPLLHHVGLHAIAIAVLGVYAIALGGNAIAAAHE